MASEDDDAQEGPLGAIELKYRDNGASIVSLSSVSQTSVHFHNHTPWDVELLWSSFPSTTQRQPESEPAVVKCTDCYRAASQLLNGFSNTSGSQTNLGDLPLDLVLCIVQHLAPNEPDVRPCESRDLVLPPSELLAAHEAAAAQIRAQLAQAAAAGAVPVISAQAGPAAELAAAQAAAQHMEGGTATEANMQTVVAGAMTSLPL
ncbi:hypothetical protein QJQ45_007732 [Haematococcus lacustris]|nr:hypothetical protein QJQ45_007732 [Haematococcus lacustris]